MEKLEEGAHHAGLIGLALRVLSAATGKEPRSATEVDQPDPDLLTQPPPSVPPGLNSWQAFAAFALAYGWRGILAVAVGFSLVVVTLAWAAAFAISVLRG